MLQGNTENVYKGVTLRRIIYREESVFVKVQIEFTDISIK